MDDETSVSVVEVGEIHELFGFDSREKSFGFVVSVSIESSVSVFSSLSILDAATSRSHSAGWSGRRSSNVDLVFGLSARRFTRRRREDRSQRASERDRLEISFE